MLYAGLDLWRQQFDVHVLDEDGATIEVAAVVDETRRPSPEERRPKAPGRPFARAQERHCFVPRERPADPAGQDRASFLVLCRQRRSLLHRGRLTDSPKQLGVPDSLSTDTAWPLPPAPCDNREPCTRSGARRPPSSASSPSPSRSSSSGAGSVCQEGARGRPPRWPRPSSERRPLPRRRPPHRARPSRRHRHHPPRPHRRPRGNRPSSPSRSSR
jgi:hypothetical protein